MGYQFNPLIFSGFDLTGGGAPPPILPPVPSTGDLPPSAPDGYIIVTTDDQRVWVYSAADSRWVDTGLSESEVFGTTPTADGYDIVLDDSVPNIRTRELVLQPADATNPGAVSTVAQDFGGVKTFVDGLDAGGNVISNVADPVAQQDAATKDYVDNADSLKANVELDNLSNTAVNDHIIPAVDDDVNLGSETNRWSDGWFANKVKSYGVILTDPGHALGLRFYETDETSNFIGVRGPTTVPTTTVFTLPDADGASGDVLATDGAGQLEFITPLPEGANKTLSNLNSPTAINQSLLPATDVTIDLGSPTKRYSSILGMNLGIDGIYNSTAGGPGGVVQVFAAELDLQGNAITNVVNPTNPQDVATKDYVDDGLATKLNSSGGTANTILFYDGSGNATSSTKVGYSTSNNNFKVVNNPAATTMSGTNGVILGYTESGGTIVTSGLASQVIGFANTGSMTASNIGSKIIGSAYDGTMASSGIGSMAMGMAYAGASGSALNEATGDAAITLGTAVTGGLVRSSGFGSFASGVAVSTGSQIVSSGTGSWVGGYVDSGDDILGSGHGSFTFGRGLINDSLLNVILGRYADATPSNPTTWVATDPLFVLGNGTSQAARNNAFTVQKDGTQFIKDPSLSGASVGYVRTLVNTSTGETAWQAGGGGGANTSLSNLVGPTAINEDLIFDTGAAATLKTKDDVTANTQDLNIFTGDATGFASGNINIVVGSSDTTTTGSVNISSGVGTQDSGGVSITTGNSPVNSGAVQLSTGTGVQTGPLSLNTGAASTGNSGSISLGTGAVSDTVPGSGGVVISTGGTAGGPTGGINIDTGVPGADGISGDIYISTGTTSGIGKSGDAVIRTGQATGAADSGNATLVSGPVSTGNTGAVNVLSGDVGVSGNSGAVNILSGYGDTSGNVTVASGISGITASGGVDIASGFTISSASTTGQVTVRSGNHTNTQGGTPTGNVSVSSGNTNGASPDSSSGAVTIASGNSTSGDSGTVTLQTGTAGVARGKILLVDGSEGTIGHVWTSTSVTGEGEWAPAPGPTARVKMTSANNAIANTGLTVLWTTTEYDPASMYNSGTGEFTIPAGQGGLYQINTKLVVTSTAVANGDVFVLYMYYGPGGVNYETIAQIETIAGTRSHPITGSDSIELNAGDIIKFAVYSSISTNITNDIHDNHVSISRIQ